jgi:hypothetical protein
MSQNQEQYNKPNKIVYVYDGDNEEDDKYFEECEIIEREIFNRFDKYLYVKIFVDSDDEELIKIYDKLIAKHNRNISKNIGFSLVSPINMITEENTYKYTLWLDVKCVCKLIMCDKNLYDGMNIDKGKDKDNYKLIPVQGLPSLKGVYKHTMTYDIDYIGNLKVDMEISRKYDIDDTYTLLNKYQYVYDLVNEDIDPVYVERVKTIEELYTTKVRM